MRTIDITTSSPYQVIVGHGLLEDCGSYIKNSFINSRAETAAIITDDAVGPLYAGRVSASLEAQGFNTIVYMIPNGEASKRIQTYLGVLEFLAENHVTRTDFIIALGGGVVGDLAGFAAATYLRKIDFIQIPTTLLAQVDSSVGGKTGVDLDAGKNLVGAFYQPKLVICDLDALDTLPDAVFKAGCAEVIKYGVLGDERLFSHLSQNALNFDREYVVGRCIEMKRDIVVEDEFDTGLRQLLNLGHTLGHAAEKLSDFTLSHGEAVSIGMAAISKAGAANGICSVECAARIANVLKKFGLPTDCDYSIDELYEAMQSDKKRKGGDISLVIPKRIGNCEIKKMPLQTMRVFMGTGL
ncbi:MAG: 3-dehydroquinate synthase [Eubacteriales bacterium]|nr:3-dehydroquinate synthase [Eubacteriales bacterium]